MGAYVNPGNDAFANIRRKSYIDKSSLIGFTNSTIRTTEMFTCFSRPRRFGKSFAAHMLCAYYDKSCDSRKLFEDLAIAQDSSFEQYLNKLDVIYLDITRFTSNTKDINHVVDEIQLKVIAELRETFKDCAIPPEETVLGDALLRVSHSRGNRFFVIIDEWDALFREAQHNKAIQKEYVQLLRGLFKGGPATAQTIAGAYMTGILPIKKYGTQSALTDFQEYTMESPAELAEYVGFTEAEVRALCESHQMDFSEMERWYDGYSFSRTPHVYSPNSVMTAIRKGQCANYWAKSETFRSLKGYITMNMDGLKDSIIAMLGGESVAINTESFQNDMVDFERKDDVLTLLVHLGYLAYDEKTRKARIPNLEVAGSLQLAVQSSDWKYVAKALEDSQTLLEDTIAGNADAVAQALSLIHEESCSVLQYNNENSLSCAVTIAYYAAKSDYTIIRELPSGKGFADLAFIPHKYSDKPAMIVELKYNRKANSAISQIKEKRYDGKLKDHGGRLLLVAVSYNKDTKEHSCIIEEA